jgi:DNA repair exonuclease SbcCD ATPase subunit
MKKTDLIERLRQNPNYTYWLDIAEAADELEAMQTRVAEIEEIFDDILEDLAHRRFALIKTGIEREKQLRERIAELEAELNRYRDAGVPETVYERNRELLREVSAKDRRIAELEGAATMLCAVLRTRTWEDKDMNACGMNAGDSSDVHALRMMEAALQEDDDG